MCVCVFLLVMRPNCRWLGGRLLACSPSSPKYLLTFSFPLNNSQLMSLRSLHHASFAAPFHCSFRLNLFPTLHGSPLFHTVHSSMPLSGPQIGRHTSKNLLLLNSCSIIYISSRARILPTPDLSCPAVPPRMLIQMAMMSITIF